MGFHVGQKVVYVGLPPGYGVGNFGAYDVGDRLKKNTVYTIRSVGFDAFAVGTNQCSHEASCRLVGVRRQLRPRVGEHGYGDMRNTTTDSAWAQVIFRPLEDTKDEIEESNAIKLFRRIAADATVAKKITV